MNLQTLSCPRCEASLKLREQENVVTCAHCGTHISVTHSEASYQKAKLNKEIGMLRQKLTQSETELGEVNTQYESARAAFAASHQISTQTVENLPSGSQHKDLMQLVMVITGVIGLLMLFGLFNMEVNTDRSATGEYLLAAILILACLGLLGILTGIIITLRKKYLHAKTLRETWTQISIPLRSRISVLEKNITVLTEQIQSLEYQLSLEP